MTTKLLIRIAGGAVLVLLLFFVFRAILRSQEVAAEHALAVEVIEEALDARQDFSEALRLVADALQEYPEDGRLHLLQARAFRGRGRLSDALEALEKGSQFSEDPDERREIQFYLAGARILRFLETRDRDDFNLAEGNLKRIVEGGRFSAAARILLGMALAQPSRYQDLEEALRLLEEGFQGIGGASVPEGLLDLELERARKVLAGLRTS